MIIFLWQCCMLLCPINGLYHKNTEYFESIINHINESPSSLWKADWSARISTIQRHSPASLELTSKMSKIRRISRYRNEPDNDSFPQSFDARSRWPDCWMIGKVYDESVCSSSWAISAASVMSDRICISSNATVKVELSALNLIACCQDCSDGCTGGLPEKAWTYWIENGLVTGGDSNSSDNRSSTGCLPYPWKKCNHTVEGLRDSCNKTITEKPSCRKQCASGYKKQYNDDIYKGKEILNITDDEDAIKKEIMTNGSVQAVFVVYDDFVTYKSGIYRYENGSFNELRAVKIIGWGVSRTPDRVPYWLCVNSWNNEWGENGLFRILRGVSECQIETYITSGTPLDSLNN